MKGVFFMANCVKFLDGLSFLRVCQKTVLQSSISEVKHCLNNKNNNDVKKHRY